MKKKTKCRLNWTRIGNIDVGITVFIQHDKFGPRAWVHSRYLPEGEEHYVWSLGEENFPEYGDEDDGFMYKNWEEL